MLLTFAGLAPARAASPAAQRGAQSQLPATPLQGELLSVADGDSFVLRAADGRVWQIRIAGIDAPERTQPWSEVARKQLRGRLQGREIRVDVTKFDVYGRIVGNVHVVEEDIGLAQIHDGMAWHFRRYANEQASEARIRYAAAETAAREAQRGLWRDPAPVEPRLFRKDRRKSARPGASGAAAP